MHPLALLVLLGCSDYTLTKSYDDAGPAASDTGTPVADDGGGSPFDGGDHGQDGLPDSGAPDTDTPPDTGPAPDTDTNVPDTVDSCETAVNITEWLDRFEVPGDGRVQYCHSQTGRRWVRIETDIDACLPHLAHAYDVFPSTLCGS